MYDKLLKPRQSFRITLCVRVRVRVRVCVCVCVCILSHSKIWRRNLLRRLPSTCSAQNQKLNSSRLEL